jgi:hypothetical protein
MSGQAHVGPPYLQAMKNRELTMGHFLGHVQQQLAVIVV